MSHDNDSPVQVRPALLDSFPDTGHVVIEASAGTGKTYTLECLVAHLLASGAASLEQILVVTFTEKATEELRGRLRQRLEALATRRSEDWGLNSEERNRLRRAVTDFEVGTISTIHGWCSKVLEENAFLQHRLFDEELIDGRDAFRQAFRQELRRALALEDSLGIELRALLADRQSVRRLESLAVQLAESRARVTPECDLSQLRRHASLAADAILASRTTLLSGVHAHYKGGTAKSLGGRLETLYRLANEIASSETLPFDRCEEVSNWFGTLRQAKSLSDLLRPVPLPSEIAREQRRRLLETIQALEQNACTRLAFVLQRLTETTLRSLRRQKQVRGEHDYDDLLTLLAEALRDCSGSALLERLRQRYRIVLIDEFQDTDEVQWEIFRRVFFDSPNDHRIVVIGDPKQAIYGFRNADVATYCQARDLLLAGKENGTSDPNQPQGLVFKLVENYRSTDSILAVQNQLFSGFFSDGTQFTEAVAGRPALATSNPEGVEAAPVVLFPVEDREDLERCLATSIGYEIQRVVEDETLHLEDERSRRAVDYDDIQILTRTRSEAIEIGGVLEEMAIPYVFYGQEGLFASDEANDLAALFSAIAEPSNRARRARAWLTPFFEVPLRDLPALQATVDSLPEGHPYSARLYRWSHLARDGNLPRLLNAILDESGVVRRARFVGGRSRQLTNYQHLFEELLISGRRLGSDPRELPSRLARLAEELGSVAGDRDQQRLNQRGDAVRIMTLHKAKGLESAIVFLFGGWSTKADDLRLYHREGERWLHVGSPPPSVRSLARNEKLAETERLVYVGITRAAHRLYLPIFGDRYLPKPSSFMRPLNDRLLTLSRSPDSSDLFEQRPLVRIESQPSNPSIESMSSWIPPPFLQQSLEWPPERLIESRRQHAAAFVTSYTQIAAQTATTLHESSATDDSDLPGGRTTGIFLHELLERLEFAEVSKARSAANLFESEPTITLYSQLAQRHSIEPTARLAAQRIAFNGLRAAIDVPGLHLPRGIASLELYSRELEFLFPALGPADQGVPDQRRYPVGPGYVQGVIDLVFERGNRFYVLDWKSDQRESFEPEALDQHVAENYRTQARLYSLALTRILDITTESDFQDRFGGILYCFLRGMGLEATNQGVHFQRPEWRDLDRWASELETLDLSAVAGGFR